MITTNKLKHFFGSGKVERDNREAVLSDFARVRIYGIKLNSLREL